MLITLPRSYTILLAPLALASAACDARPEAGASNTARQPECVASGAKHLTPPLSDAAACVRFQSGIAAIPGVTGVQLKVLPQGVLNAIISRAGTNGAPTDYGLAVSDRALTADDLDRLASNVVTDLAPGAPKQR